MICFGRMNISHTQHVFTTQNVDFEHCIEYDIIFNILIVGMGYNLLLCKMAMHMMIQENIDSQYI
jgi:hypothetical protein